MMQINVVTGLVFICLFLIGICAIEHHFRFSRLPYICWVVLFGAGYGLLDAHVLRMLPDLDLTPDVILYIFLPILIFDSSRKLDMGLARQVAIPSFLLATVGLLISMFVMAVPLHVFKGIPWRDALFFAAIMSATDPVAVSAIFGQFHVPGRLKTLIEGESLLNDGTAVILFIALSGIAIEGKALMVPREIVFFVASIAGAVLVGALAGWCGVWVIRKWRALDDHFVGPLLPLIIVYLIFCGTQAGLEISGVIAVMAGTLTMRILGRHLPAAERPRKADIAFSQGLWDFLGELVNALLFFMLGVEIGGHGGEIVWAFMPLVIGALLLARSTVCYGFGLFSRLVGKPVPLAWLHILNLGGLKGALSVALILMIPRDYPFRHMFLCAALALCLFTLICNTLAMRAYLDHASLKDPAGPSGT